MLPVAVVPSASAVQHNLLVAAQHLQRANDLVRSGQASGHGARPGCRAIAKAQKVGSVSGVHNGVCFQCLAELHGKSFTLQGAA